jgi:ribosomal protein S12 methylthiotransferase
VAGCLVQRYRRELEEAYAEIDVLRGIADFPPKPGRNGFIPEVRLTPRHTAYVKIAEGCANPCTYCAIPRIKGPLRSRSEEEVLREVRELDAQGVREINIVGQDITLYGPTPRRRTRGLPLVRLLNKILKQTRIPWVRLLYLHPQRLTDELVALIASAPRICSYIDVPLQHVSTRILKAMGRRMTRAQVFALIGRVRRRIPDAALRTAFIAGFPGETKQDFRELCLAVTDLRFDRMGVFMYSREEGTAAYGLKGQKCLRVRRERRDHLMRLQADVSRRNLRRDVGRIWDILIEAKAGRPGVYVGRSYKDAPEVDGVVRVRARRALAPGALVACRITASSTHDLSGECVP